jgi:cbb3-type cytochrome oxidase cytochrome c subunit
MAEAIEKLPSNERKTYRQISGALGVSVNVVQRAQHGENSFHIPHTNSIKPFLAEINKYGCVSFAMERIVYRYKNEGELV